MQTEQLLWATPIHEVEIQEEVVAVVSAVPVLQASNNEVEVHRELADGLFASGCSDTA